MAAAEIEFLQPNRRLYSRLICVFTGTDDQPTITNHRRNNICFREIKRPPRDRSTYLLLLRPRDHDLPTTGACVISREC